MDLRGQYALEQMVVITLALVIIAALFAFSINAASDGARTAQAKDTVERIARAADSAYSLGPGSRSTVSVTMPQGVELVDISNKRVLVRVATSSGKADAFASTRGQLIGYIPTTAAQQEITMTVLPSGDIAVGRTMLLCSPSSFTKTIQQGGSASDTLTLTDVWAYGISTFTSNISGVFDMAGNGALPSSLSSGASSPVSLSFTVAGGKPVGAYTGSITVNASNASACTSSITVFVTSSASPDTLGPTVSGLSVSPASPTIATAVNVSATAADANSTVAGCAIGLDSSGVWNPMSATDGSFSSPSEAINYYLGTLDQGNHTVDAYCTDSIGNSGAVSSLNFSVANVAGGSISADTWGPVVTNISISPSAPNTNTSSIRVNATANDTANVTGNISMCQFAYDGFNWDNMNASDGSYNLAPIENVTDAFGPVTSPGNHSLGIRCNDSAGNWGAVYSFSFMVNGSARKPPKDMLFITNVSNAPTTNELQWAGFISLSLSDLGFNWSKDDYSRANVTAGAVNLSNYRMAVLAEAVNPGLDAAFYGILRNYSASGHYVVLLGAAGQYGAAPMAMNITSSNGTSASAAVTVVNTTSHYITSWFGTTGSKTIYSTSSPMWYHSATLYGTKLTSTTTVTQTTSVDNSTKHVLLFTLTLPANFNANGTNLSRHAIDWALNNSAPGVEVPQ